MVEGPGREESVEWLTSFEVAGMLKVSTRTLWRLVARKIVPEPVRINRKLVRWRREEIERWMREQSSLYDPPMSDDGRDFDHR